MYNLTIWRNTILIGSPEANVQSKHPFYRSLVASSVSKLNSFVKSSCRENRFSTGNDKHKSTKYVCRGLDTRSGCGCHNEVSPRFWFQGLNWLICRGKMRSAKWGPKIRTSFWKWPQSYACVTIACPHLVHITRTHTHNGTALLIYRGS